MYLFLFLAVLGRRFCARAFSSCGEWGPLFIAVSGPLTVAASRRGAQAQQLWPMGLVAPRHVGSSHTRARTCVPCIGRQILNHCATREAHATNFLTSTGRRQHYEKVKMCWLLFKLSLLLGTAWSLSLLPGTLRGLRHISWSYFQAVFHTSKVSYPIRTLLFRVPFLWDI